MRLIGLALFLSFLIPITTAFGRDKVNCYKADTNITVDASLDEWSGHPLHHFNDRMFSVSARHDEKNMYILYATRDQRLMQMIETAGITIWLHPKDKTDKEYGLFLIGEAGLPERPQGNRMPPEGEIPEERKGFNKERKEEMKGRVKVTTQNGEYLFDKEGNEFFAVANGMYKDVYLIEMRIPFENEGVTAGLPFTEKNKFAVGIEYAQKMGEMKRPDKGNGMGMRGGGMDGGGRMGGGRGGRNGGGMDQKREQMAQMKEITKDFWFTLELPKDKN